jgi:hypothetical protein
LAGRLVDVATIVLAVSTALGGGGSLFLWLETHASSFRERRSKEAKSMITEQITPMQTDIREIQAKIQADREHHAAMIEAALGKALEPVRDQLSILNTKVEPLWTALIQMGINQTNVLHQPDPRRAEVDHLLEELQHELRDGVLMPADDFVRLQHFLVMIKGWEPGMDLGFPVLPAEPTSAAILLSVMGLSRQRRRQGTT